MKVKVGDRVKVIAGKSKGTVSKVIKTDAKHNRVTVEGANMVTKHVKPSAMSTGGIETVEASMDASNVMLVTSEDKVTRKRSEASNKVKEKASTKKSKEDKDE